MRSFACPYCFEIIQEDQVLFRSDKVTFPNNRVGFSENNSTEPVFYSYETPVSKAQEIEEEILRLEQEDKQLLRAKNQLSWPNYRYIIPDSEEKERAIARHNEIEARINQLREESAETPVSVSNQLSKNQDTDSSDPSFFDFVEHDPIYERFWDKFGGTTENNPGDDILGGKSYQRKLIDPKNPAHQKYLRRQRDTGSQNSAEDYFIRDGDDVVKMVELDDPVYRYCNVRVCPKCHNPLPENFGKNEVKNIVVIGVRGSGKTVYLSRLLQDMRNYALKVGLTAHVNGNSIREFGQKNPVKLGVPLPDITFIEQFQQPLVYDMTRNNGHNRVTETLVMYDVAGEVFEEKETLLHFASYIKHAHGIILLIDPSQLDNIQRSLKDNEGRGEPTKVLQACYNMITENQSGKEKCPIPVAVCLSKMDEIQDVMMKRDASLWRLLMEDVHQQLDAHGYPLPLFNASQYNPILEKMLTFFKEQDMPLAQMMHTDFAKYAYFAFSALGCSVTEKKETIQTSEGEREITRLYPANVVVPKRIEEPMLWLFYQFHYIGTNVPIDNPDDHIPCPECHSLHTEILPEEDRKFTTKIGLFKKITEYHNLYCNECGCHWFDAKADEQSDTGGEAWNVT